MQVQDGMIQIVDGPHHEQTLEYSIVLTNLSPGLTYIFKVWCIPSNVKLDHKMSTTNFSAFSKGPCTDTKELGLCYVEFLLLPALPTHLPHSPFDDGSKIIKFVVYLPQYTFPYGDIQQKENTIHLWNFY